MSDAPKPQSKPHRKRIGGPPKPPTRVTLDLMDESGGERRRGGGEFEMETASMNAVSSLYELIRMDGGGRPLKREALELSVDRNVVLLGKLVSKLENEDVEKVKGVLREICDYRVRHPRADASNPEQADQARKVLDELA